MNLFLLDAKSRLLGWKVLREQIAQSENLDHKIQLCLRFWQQAPIENPTIDWDNSRLWPTPWEMLHSNRFCESALSLGVAYTLLLSDSATFHDLKLLLITDRQAHVQKIVAKTCSQVLNFGWLDQHNASVLNGSQLHNKWVFDGRQWQTTI